MTDPPALAFATGITKFDQPLVAYVAVYPLVMILRVFIVSPGSNIADVKDSDSFHRRSRQEIKSSPTSASLTYTPPTWRVTVQ
jgi:hypothetical protein